MNSIEHIILKCLANDRAAQGQLYQQSKDHLMQVAYRYCPDISTAKDALQNGFIKIFKKLDQFDIERGSFKNWSARIVINEALQIKRKKKELPMPENAVALEAYTEVPNLDRLTLQELTNVMDLLPETHRVILNLYYFEEYSHQEISEILNIKCSTSRGQLSRARQVLIKKWEMYNLTIHER